MKIYDEILVDGLSGKWEVVNKSKIKDMNGKTKTVYALEHTVYGEDVRPVFVDHNKRILKGLASYFLLQDIEDDMLHNAWEDIEQL